MNKLLLGLIGLVLVGAGCIPVANAPVDGKWPLTFTLPSGWVMVEPYTNSTKPVSDAVTRDLSTVWLQSSNDKLCLALYDVCPAKDLADGGTIVKVTKFDSHRVLPKNLKDLGNSLFRDEGFCDAIVDTAPGHSCVDPYYLKAGDINYHFQIEGDVKVADEVIRSAKLVTHFTDVTTIQVK